MDECKSEVAEAFELLLEALDEERKQVAERLSQIALTEGVTAAQKVLQRLSFLEQLKAQVQGLYESWQNGRMVQPEISPREQVPIEPKSVDRDPTVEWLSRLVEKPRQQKASRGMLDSAFRPFILKALAQLGGRARVEEVLERVERMVKPFLSPVDLEPVPSGTEPRWRNRARWERFKMVQEGLLRPDSPRGIWELTELGWQEARKLLEGEN